MMTREEAIRIFEEWTKCNYQPTREAAQLAVAALTLLTQEQAERAAEVIIKYSESEDQNVCHIS